MRESFISFILTTGFVVFIGSQACTSDNTESLNPENNINHVTVYFEEGKFGGWPANWGIWAWDNEILVSFTKADHMENQPQVYKVLANFCPYHKKSKMTRVHLITYEP